MGKWAAYKRQIGAGLALVALLVGVGVVWVHRMGILWAIPKFMKATGAWGLALSYGLVVLQSIVPYAPFALLAGFNVAAHGFWLGFALTLAGVVTGDLILYAFARQIIGLVFHGAIEAIWRRHPKLEVVKSKVVGARFWTAFVILFALRVQPWVPSSLLDLLSGATGVRFKPFFFSTVAGQAPAVAAMAFLGHRLLHFQHFKREMKWIILLITLLVVAFVMWRVMRKRSVGKRAA